jgi:hypothetical protein
MKNNQCILHGECIVTPIDSVPAEAAQIETKGNYQIVADSEVTGNHHVVDLKPGVSFFKTPDKMFMSTTVPTAIRCVKADRHTEIDIPAGNYEFGFQQEYDYFTEALRNVRD